jgi:hypothetical protein
LYTFDEFVQYYSMVLGSREAGEREWASAEKVARFYVVICDSSETGSFTMCRNIGGEPICQVEGEFVGLEVAWEIRRHMPAIRDRLQLISEHGNLLWAEPMREARNGQLYTFDEFVDYYGLEAGEVEWKESVWECDTRTVPTSKVLEDARMMLDFIAFHNCCRRQ